MMYNPDKHHRRSIRLKGYDYTQPGAYFITACTHRWGTIFGEIIDGKMRLNPLGRVVQAEWLKTAQIRSNVQVDEFIVMPNHVHGIIMIMDSGDTARSIPTAIADTAHRIPTVEQFGKPVSGSLPTIVRAFKSAATRRINILRSTPGRTVWQRKYYEHIVRSERSLNRIREYIHYNPQRWHLDRYHPADSESLEQPKSGRIFSWTN